MGAEPRDAGSPHPSPADPGPQPLSPSGRGPVPPSRGRRPGGHGSRWLGAGGGPGSLGTPGKGWQGWGLAPAPGPTAPQKPCHKVQHQGFYCPCGVRGCVPIVPVLVPRWVRVPAAPGGGCGCRGVGPLLPVVTPTCPGCHPPLQGHPPHGVPNLSRNTPVPKCPPDPLPGSLSDPSFPPPSPRVTPSPETPPHPTPQHGRCLGRHGEEPVLPPRGPPGPRPP